MIPKSQLKYIQSLGQKKYRDEHHVFIAEGPKLVAELLQNETMKVQTVLAVKEWIDAHQELQSGTHFIEISEKELERISQLVTPHQVLAVCEQFENRLPVTTGKLSLVLDGISDPGNLGTIIRIADWFSVTQIICSHDCVDRYNPKTVQATMGSIGRVALHYTHLPEWIKDQTVRSYATVIGGSDVRKMNPVHEGLIVVGNESRGIHPDLLSFAHEKISIPGKGGAESLNVAVATGIILSFLTG